MTRSSQDLLFTPEQVAEQLGLHVKTVRRYIREGQLDAVRVGKRYRVTRASLEAFTGVPLEEPPPSRAAFTEVSTIVSIDNLGRDGADRLTTLLVASAQGQRAAEESLRVQTIHYPERHRLKVVVSGDLAATMSMLALINTLLDDRP